MKITLNILLLFVLFQSSAQNLVPNPSFEQYTLCPDAASQIDRATFWFNANLGTSDYFNACFAGGPQNLSVPQNWIGNQSARTGDAYIGLYTYYTTFPYQYREYAQVQMSAPLVSGQEYYVSFHISHADSSTIAADRIGIHLSPFQINQNDQLNIGLTPHIENSPGNVVYDNATWTKISGTFVASGGEQFLILGNFYDNSNTDTVQIINGSGHTAHAYYYIDDICVSTDSATCNIGVGINDLTKPDKQLIRVLDTMGRETTDKPNTLIIYIYSDGSTEKVFRVE